MRIFNFSIYSFFLIIILTACISFGGLDPNEPVEVTPGPNQSQSPGSTPSQDNLVRGPIFLEEFNLLIMESFPVQIALQVKGELPTPCHSFSYSIAQPNEKKEIHVDMYSLIEEGVICIQVIQPFEDTVSVPMIGQPEGEYTVWINGELVGEFSYPG